MQKNLNQFVTGIQQASAAGMTTLPSRDIPQNQQFIGFAAAPKQEEPIREMPAPASENILFQPLAVEVKSPKETEKKSQPKSPESVKSATEGSFFDRI